MKETSDILYFMVYPLFHSKPLPLMVQWRWYPFAFQLKSLRISSL